MSDVYQLKPAVDKAAKQAERRWGKILSAEDIGQELWMFIVESPSVQKYLLKLSEGKRVTALKVKADSVCSKERLDYEYFTGNWLYSIRDVQEIVCKSRKTTKEEELDLKLGLTFLYESNRRYYDLLTSKNESPKSPADRVATSRALAQLTDLMNTSVTRRKNNRTQGLGTRPTIKKESNND